MIDIYFALKVLFIFFLLLVGVGISSCKCGRNIAERINQSAKQSNHAVANSSLQKEESYPVVRKAVSTGTRKEFSGARQAKVWTEAEGKTGRSSSDRSLNGPEA